MNEKTGTLDILNLNRKQRRQLGSKIAVGYSRVSTQNQLEEGLSLATQENEIKKKAKELDLFYRMTYVDGGISGSDIEHRSGMIQLLEDAKQGYLMR